MTARRAGILLHPSSLPGSAPIGDFGPAIEDVLDWARDAGFSLWQVLPLGPTSFGDSPYGALSSFAGNPLFVSAERLLADGLLPRRGVPTPASAADDRVDFAAARAFKEALLRAAHAHAGKHGPAALRKDLAAWSASEAAWLDDWALYAALKAEQGGAAWTDWPAPLRDRAAEALADARTRLAAELGFHRFVQWAFFRQWQAVRAAAAARGVLLVGDLPIYVAHDSADVWARRELFQLDSDGAPTVVAGVPPDYFSATGQRWGNPLYAWPAHEQEGFRWWTARVRASLRFGDVVRLDHFRGFVGAWEIPTAEKTAAQGRWVATPGRALLETLRAELGELPLLAEDLGVITPDVERLRDDFGLPGMKVLQFAFGTVDATHLPHHHREATVAYTGTHDNDTTRGAFTALDAEAQARWRDYLGPTTDGGAWDPTVALVRAAYTSVARWAVVPAQDLFGLASEGRMNVPGAAAHNWTWRARAEHFDAALARRLRRLAEISGRWTVPREPADYEKT